MKPLNYYKKQRKNYNLLLAAIHRSIFGSMKINENIRALRMARGLTQEVMAARLNMDVANYSRMERGITKLTIDRLEEIARILNFKTADLFHLSLQGTSEPADMQSQLLERNNQLLETMLQEVKELNERKNFRVINEMQSALERDGYFHHHHCGSDLLHAVLARLGTVIFTTDVTVKAESAHLVTSAKGLDYHTDHHKANYILWHCVRQSSRGGESILVDARKAFNALSASHKKALHEIRLFEHKVFPDDRDSYPLAETIEGEVNLYYSFWLVKKEDKAHPALVAFQAKLREIGQVKILLQPGDILAIDNHRMFHGRTPIEDNRDRLLRRFWIAKETYSFHNNKNQ